MKILSIFILLFLLNIKVNAQYVLPGGGANLEDWYLGNTVNISWVTDIITNSATNRVNVELWNGSDNTTTTIADNIQDLGNLQFQIPQSLKPDKRYKIRIKNIGENAIMTNDDFLNITQFPSKDKDTTKVDQNLVKIYPNPAIDVMYIEFATPSKFDFKLQFFDNIGKQLTNIIRNIDLDNPKIVKLTLDLSQISNGKYYFVYNSNSGPRLIQFMKV